MYITSSNHRSWRKIGTQYMLTEILALLSEEQRSDYISHFIFCPFQVIVYWWQDVR